MMMTLMNRNMMTSTVSAPAANTSCGRANIAVILGAIIVASIIICVLGLLRISLALLVLVGLLGLILAEENYKAPTVMAFDRDL